jgi:hypothetical protein
MHPATQHQQVVTAQTIEVVGSLLKSVLDAVGRSGAHAARQTVQTAHAKGKAASSCTPCALRAQRGRR